MAELLLETVTLKAGIGLQCLDAWSGQPVIDGLRCTLRRKRDGLVLGQSVASPSGVQHWPGLHARWQDGGADAGPGASPPSPPSLPPPAQAEILIEDSFERFLPLRLDWPPLTQGGTHLAIVTLLSAPQRGAPPGSAGVNGLLVGPGEQAAAWARVLVTDAAARATEAMSDAEGRFTLYLPFPRPERRPADSPPSPPSPPSPAGAVPAASVTLRIFHDPAVALEARRSQPRAGRPVPLWHLWRAQTEVRALADLAGPGALGPVRLEPGRLAVPHTEGLPSNRSELRLVPL